MRSGYMGALRHVLKLQDFTLVADGNGDHQRVWQALPECIEVYAAIHDIGAGRSTEAGEFKTVMRHKLIIAYRPDVRPDMRLIGDNRIYTIEAVLDVANRKEYLELQARSE